MYTTQVMPRVGLTNEGRSASISGGHLARTSTEIWVKSYKRGKSFTGIWESSAVIGVCGNFLFANFAHRPLAFFANGQCGLLRQVLWQSGTQSDPSRARSAAF